MVKKGDGGSGLGKQLLKKQKIAKRGPKPNAEGYLHTADMQDGYDWGRMNFKSVTEEVSYIDFLNTAEQASKDFDAEKWNVQLLDAQTRQVYIDTSKTHARAAPALPEDMTLPIPRRPDWIGLTPVELKDEENKAFLEWRRYLSQIQEETETVVTPYEKNLEFWRQLWRVIERSDLVVQIVDCRNPLLFRSRDLEKYVKEVNPLKQNLILLNKADYLTEKQRLDWAKYLKENIGDTKFAFFSAIEEDSELENIEEESEQTQPKENLEEDDEDPLDENTEDATVDEVTEKLADDCNIETAQAENQSTEEKSANEKEEKSAVKIEGHNSNIDDVSKIMSSEELMQVFRTFKRHDPEQITVGFIGYPNVGKSSTINKLINSKKVRVSETPGKTKHFQTIVLCEDITLCDCPGLVMPSIVSSKPEMVLNGILPVDQLRDHVPSVNLMLQYIPTHVLEYKYGLVLPQEPEILTSEQVMTAYAIMRGYMAVGGRADQSRGARVILKEFVSGKLLYVKAPPTLKQEEFHIFERQIGREWCSVEAKEQEAKRLQQIKKLPHKELDDKFFSGPQTGIQMRGRKAIGIGGYGASGMVPGMRLSDIKKLERRKGKARKIFADQNAK